MVVFEEVGELSHAHLKGLQGIRYTPEVIHRKKVDAIGDILIGLLHYCHAEKINLELCLVSTWNQVKHRDFQKDKIRGGE